MARGAEAPPVTPLRHQTRFDNNATENFRGSLDRRRDHETQPEYPAGDLRLLQRQTFDYFLNEVNAANGLVCDKSAANWPASIAATGLALACYPVGVERGFIARQAAAARTLTTLRFFLEEPSRARAQRYWAPWLLLSFSRHADRPARLAMRARFRFELGPNSMPMPTMAMTVRPDTGVRLAVKRI